MEKEYHVPTSKIRILWLVAFMILLIPAVLLSLVAIQESKYDGPKLDFQFYAMCFSGCELFIALPLAYFLFIRNAIKLKKIRLSINSDRIEFSTSIKTISFKWKQIKYLSECRFLERRYLYRNKINRQEKYLVMKSEYYELYEVGDGKNVIRFNCYFGKNAPDAHMMGNQKMLRIDEYSNLPSSFLNITFMGNYGITLSNTVCNELFHLIFGKM